MIELGGNITLVGFRELEPAELIVVKKMVGSYARKMSDLKRDFENLTVTLKEIHKTPKSQKYELHGKVMVAGKPTNSEVVERNLFIALDAALRKLITVLEK